jgi:hypothetical protein
VQKCNYKLLFQSLIASFWFSPAWGVINKGSTKEVLFDSFLDSQEISNQVIQFIKLYYARSSAI